jgi:hypothetical protein
MQQLMKSMREATPAPACSTTRHQARQRDARQPVRGEDDRLRRLTDAIARQLERQMGRALWRSGRPACQPALAAAATSSPLSLKQVDFVQQHAGAARAAEAQSGIRGVHDRPGGARVGLGRQEIRTLTGSSARNLFGQGRRRLERPGRRDHDH